jgi:hypothetical protein
VHTAVIKDPFEGLFAMIRPMKLIEIDTPEYTVDKEPDYKAIGRRIDEEIKKHFAGKEILLRGVGSRQHKNMAANDLVDVIKETGTDRYDPTLKGDRYENIEGKHIDLFAFPATVTLQLDLGQQVIFGFYHSAIGVHGSPVRVDVLTVYDATQFDEVVHQYQGHGEVKRDGFVFKDPDDKQKSVLGIIKLNGG